MWVAKVDTVLLGRVGGGRGGAGGGTEITSEIDWQQMPMTGVGGCGYSLLVRFTSVKVASR